MDKRILKRWRLALTAAIVAAGFAASLVADYPGHFVPDSVWQLAQGRAGLYNDWHPPVMAWLLGLADRLSPGAWPFVLLEATLFYGGLLAVAALEPRPRLIGLALLILWMVSPLAFIYQGIVLKDVLFADAVLAGFAALAWAGRLRARPVARGALLMLALSLLGLAGLTRQNGLIAPLCGVLAVAVMDWDGPAAGERVAGPGRAALRGALALAFVAAVTGLGAWALETRGDHRPETANHMAMMQLYDLAGMIRQDGSLDLPILDRARPDLARFLRRQAAPRWRSAAVDSLYAAPGGKAMMTVRDPAVGRQWIALITARPWLYLRTRARVWRSTLFTPTADACPMYFTGVDGGDPARLRAAGLHTRDTDKDDWDDDYAHAFLATPLFSHAVYGVLLCLALAAQFIRWRRGDRDPALIAVLALGLSAFLATASYFFISIACDYRYLYELDVAAMALVLRVATARPRR